MPDPNWSDKAMVFDQEAERKYREEAKEAARRMSEFAADGRVLPYIESIYEEVSHTFARAVGEARDIIVPMRKPSGDNVMVEDNALWCLALMTLYRIHAETSAMMPPAFKEVLQELFVDSTAPMHDEATCYHPPIVLKYADEEGDDENND